MFIKIRSQNQSKSKLIKDVYEDSSVPLCKTPALISKKSVSPSGDFLYSIIMVDTVLAGIP